MGTRAERGGCASISQRQSSEETIEAVYIPPEVLRSALRLDSRAFRECEDLHRVERADFEQRIALMRAAPRQRQCRAAGKPAVLHALHD